MNAYFCTEVLLGRRKVVHIKQLFMFMFLKKIQLILSIILQLHLIDIAVYF